MSRRVRRLLVTGLTLVILAAISVGGWFGASLWQASKVTVLAGQLSECADDSSIVQSAHMREMPETEEAATMPEAFLRLDGRLDCELVTTVESQARVPVELEGLRWPAMGPRGGSGIGLAAGSGLDVFIDLEGASLDALFGTTPPIRLDPATAREFVVHASYNGRCKAAGTEGFVPNSPIATIRVLGWRHTLTAVGQGVGYKGTRESSCDQDSTTN